MQFPADLVEWKTSFFCAVLGEYHYLYVQSNTL